MSELIEKNDNSTVGRRKLFMGVSVLALTAVVVSGASAAADDADRPTVWIELGGEMQQMQGLSNPFVAPFMNVTPVPAPYVGDSFIGLQNPPSISVALDGKLSIRPEGSDWTFSVGIQYGRSHSNRHIHHQTPNQPAELTFYFAYYHTNYHISTTFPEQPHADTKTQFSESHAVLDFQAGRDVGVGLFGSQSTSTLSAGVRFAQFNSRSSVDIQARPAVNTDIVYETLFSGYISVPFLRPDFHQYKLDASATRSFRGIGPELSWNASAAIAGNSQDVELTVDWGIDAAVLFGRQKAKTSHATQTNHLYFTHSGSGFNGFHSHYPIVGSNNGHSTRSRQVIVPNLGGFAGFSVNYPNAKVSFGYRADFFFGAMDTGIDVRHTKDLGFSGPFASVSIGLGG